MRTSSSDDYSQFKIIYACLHERKYQQFLPLKEMSCCLREECDVSCIVRKVLNPSTKKVVESGEFVPKEGSVRFTTTPTTLILLLPLLWLATEKAAWLVYCHCSVCVCVTTDGIRDDSRHNATHKPTYTQTCMK